MTSNVYSDEAHAFIWNGTAYQKLTCNNILWIEKIDQKIRLISHDHHYWLNISLEELHKLLPCPSLKQVHTSFIVNLNRIEGFDGLNILIRQKSIPIGKSYMDFFNEHFKVAPEILILTKNPPTPTHLHQSLQISA